jgi:Spy/CpxP family protein refolding chaperone
MKRLLCSLMMAVAVTAPGASAEPSGEHQQLIEAQVAEVAARLELTDAQRAQVEPIILSSLEQQMAVLESHGIDPEAALGGSMQRPNPRKALALRRDLDEVRAGTRDELAAVLSDAQLAELAEIQDERRAEMRARMQGR